MIRRVLVVLVVALLGLLVAGVPARGAYVFGAWTVTSPPPLADSDDTPYPDPTDSSCLSEDECIVAGVYGAGYGPIGLSS